jgi:hypothetical protein
LSLRIPAHLRAQIDEKVKETGTNTSHVVETLLMEALAERNRGEGLFRDAATLKYGHDLARILLCIGDAMQTIGDLALFTKQGKGRPGAWRADPWAFDQAVRAAQMVLDYARPEGELVEPPPVTDEERASKFWETSYRYFLDHSPLDHLRLALAREPAPTLSGGDPFLIFGLQRLAAELNDDDQRNDEK